MVSTHRRAAQLLALLARSASGRSSGLLANGRLPSALLTATSTSMRSNGLLGSFTQPIAIDRGFSTSVEDEDEAYPIMYPPGTAVVGRPAPGFSTGGELSNHTSALRAGRCMDHAFLASCATMLPFSSPAPSPVPEPSHLCMARAQPWSMERSRRFRCPTTRCDAVCGLCGAAWSQVVRILG